MNNLNILLYPTNEEDVENLNIPHFINWLRTKDNGLLTDCDKWSRALENKIAWYDGIQEDFEEICERYWLANSLDEGFFPGGAVKIAHANKMNARLETKQVSSLSLHKDKRDAMAAERIVSSIKTQLALQRAKVDMCKLQLSQSESKQLELEMRLTIAEERLSAFDTSSSDL